MIRPEEEWREHLAAGRFMLQRSRSTGRYVFYPRLFAPGTGEADLEWSVASGNGIVYAVTVIRKKDPSENYNIVLVDLAEGPRMMSRVDGVHPDSVKIGMAVRAKIINTADEPLLVFEPA